MTVEMIIFTADDNIGITFMANLGFTGSRA